MVPEDLLFWIAPIGDAPTMDPSLLCRRHADAMVVPRGWTLDDRREPIPRLFNTRSLAKEPVRASPPRRRRSSAGAGGAEQMQIDGTGEIGRPSVAELESTAAPDGAARAVPAGPDADTVEPWQPDFRDGDLDGLLQVTSPLLARAFRGTNRPKR